MTLPPRGSAQDRILEEIQQRERAERLATVSLFAHVIGGGLGVRPEAIAAMLEDYQDTLLENVYRPEFIRRKLREKTAVAAKKTKKQLDDAALIKKLEGFTEPEEPRARKR